MTKRILRKMDDFDSIRTKKKKHNDSYKILIFLGGKMRKSKFSLKQIQVPMHGKKVFRVFSVRFPRKYLKFLDFPTCC